MNVNNGTIRANVIDALMFLIGAMIAAQTSNDPKGRWVRRGES
jgi:hypothetical protein